MEVGNGLIPVRYSLTPTNPLLSCVSRASSGSLDSHRVEVNLAAISLGGINGSKTVASLCFFLDVMAPSGAVSSDAAVDSVMQWLLSWSLFPFLC